MFSSSYWAKTPKWLKWIFPNKFIWRMPACEPVIYLTFDDGPHHTATNFILDLLTQYGVKATFFCIGKNVVQYPDLYSRILSEGHTVGNHTHNHINGWRTDNTSYLRNILQAREYINSNWFRPPYGRIKPSQARMLYKTNKAWRICMWDVVAVDYDAALTPEQCVENVINNIEPGSIVVFHDSERAWERMRYALPQVMEYCKKNNWKMLPLPQE